MVTLREISIKKSRKRHTNQHDPQNKDMYSSRFHTHRSPHTLPLTLRVHFLGYFKSIRVGQVSVGWGYGEDQATLLGDELQQHVSDLVLDIRRLVPHSHFGHPRQVDQGQI